MVFDFPSTITDSTVMGVPPKGTSIPEAASTVAFGKLIVMPNEGNFRIIQIRGPYWVWVLVSMFS